MNPNFTINLFPNPAGDQLNVWMEGVQKKTDIKVYDLMGKLVMQQAKQQYAYTIKYFKTFGWFLFVEGE